MDSAGSARRRRLDVAMRNLRSRAVIRMASGMRRRIGRIAAGMTLSGIATIARPTRASTGPTVRVTRIKTTIEPDLEQDTTRAIAIHTDDAVRAATARCSRGASFAPAAPSIHQRSRTCAATIAFAPASCSALF